ncbi:hypothetical protein T310_6054 [Rasamsonia emersonii CBS 393.64]|uniref:Uncharacterized protein n=1 Tax=Rasamsonia emersonii (strain ATCC 16479 / CBS 393.64 / IMI 116815) TaxID=1408163 RepID=A0A0F4YPB5_RASE3|nr:hypothetical protein T310_6054 [Rasamsonia emersonii CBS 393.64]KKA19940.1 hypothetical protein T310_6054 [Rasamsonia emersonii CBS 393.64]
MSSRSSDSVIIAGSILERCELLPSFLASDSIGIRHKISKFSESKPKYYALWRTLQAAGAAPDCVPDRSGMESTETRGFSGPAPWSIGQSPWWWMKCAPLIGRPGKKEQKKDAIGELVLASRLQKREERH